MTMLVKSCRLGYLVVARLDTPDERLLGLLTLEQVESLIDLLQPVAVIWQA